MANPNGRFSQFAPSNVRSSAVKAMKGVPKMGVGSALIDGYLNLKSGDDLGTAAFKAAGSAMLWSIAPGVMTAQMLGSMGVEAYSGFKTWERQARENYRAQTYQGVVGNGFQDTARAQTMRQAALQAIQGSKLNARSALGGEAQIINKNFTRTL
jgi:hypothetical protein